MLDSLFALALPTFLLPSSANLIFLSSTAHFSSLEWALWLWNLWCYGNMLWIVTSYRNISLRLDWFSITYFSLLLFIKVYYTIFQIRYQVTPHCLKTLHHKFIFSLFSRNKPYLLSNLLLSFTTVSHHSNFTGVILHFRAVLDAFSSLAMPDPTKHFTKKDSYLFRNNCPM